MPYRSKWPNTEMWKECAEWRRGGLTYGEIEARLSREENIRKFGLQAIPKEDTIRRELRKLAIRTRTGRQGDDELSVKNDALGSATPSIQVVSDPKDNYAQLKVVNKGSRALFTATAQILDDGVPTGTAWPVRWRGSTSAEEAINMGAERILGIASVSMVHKSRYYSLLGDDRPDDWETRVTFHTADQVDTRRKLINEFTAPDIPAIELLLSITSDPPMEQPYKRRWLLSRTAGEWHGKGPTLYLEQSAVDLPLEQTQQEAGQEQRKRRLAVSLNRDVMANGDHEISLRIDNLSKSPVRRVFGAIIGYEAIQRGAQGGPVRPPTLGTRLLWSSRHGLTAPTVMDIPGESFGILDVALWMHPAHTGMQGEEHTDWFWTPQHPEGGSTPRRPLFPLPPGRYKVTIELNSELGDRGRQEVVVEIVYAGGDGLVGRLIEQSA